jgi:hypothetical protein
MDGEDLRDPWQKLQDLIELAKERPVEVGEVLRHKPPSEVTQLLQREDINMTMDDLGRIFSDLEHIADRNSGRYWSPLA